MSASKALPVPPAEMRFMGEDEAGFVRIGDEMVSRIGTVVDLAALRRVVDIGCGYGRIGAGFVRSKQFTGHYDGFDLLEPHIAWCNANLGDARTRFHHLPIHSERYNPTGTLQQTDVRFDVPDRSADLIVLTSVFTHMYPDDVAHYLRECRRMLSPTGRIYATFFMMNEQQAGRTNLYPLEHELTPFCRFMNPDEPLHVIAYTEAWLREQFAAAGLFVEGPIRQGEWSGETGAFDFQDTVVLGALEHEITEPVDECDAKGRLNPAARGWSRQPLLRANLKGRSGRKKRWDYWCIDTPELVVSFVYADVDYAGLANVWVLDRVTGQQATAGVLKPFAKGFVMPEQVCTGTVSFESDAFRLRIEETPGITRIVAWSPEIDVDVEVAKPAGHESLNVMIPWSERTFQFTSKQNSRPATGTVKVGDRQWTVGPDAWGVQDLGRGIWPYSNRWNWAAATGHATDGRLVGLQFGGKWTVGTGATENALCIDGRLTKISEELEWTYDWSKPMAPWHVRTRGSDQIDVTLTPTFDRYDVTDLKMLKMEVHQCFGTWSGRIVGDDGVPAEVQGIRGFAEEARNRW